MANKPTSKLKAHKKVVNLYAGAVILDIKVYGLF